MRPGSLRSLVDFFFFFFFDFFFSRDEGILEVVKTPENRFSFGQYI